MVSNIILIIFSSYFIITAKVIASLTNDKTAWKMASEFLKSTLDNSHNACDDFYGFACQSWIRKKDNHEGTKTFFLKPMHKMLEDADINDPETPAYFTMAKTYYDQCINYEEKREKCFEDTKGRFSSALIAMMFKKNKWNITEWINDLNYLANYVISSFKYFIQESDWLPTTDKNRLIEEVNKITFYGGLPEWLKYESEVTRRTPIYNMSATYLENYYCIPHNGDEYSNFSEVEQHPPVIRTQAKNVNNKIINYASGNILPPLYHPKYPASVKFGGFGAVVAHEMFYSFEIKDVQQFPLSNMTLKRFEEERKCISDKYNKMCDKFNRKECYLPKEIYNHELDLIDLVIDVDGMKLAYSAFKQYERCMKEEPCLPGLSEYTNDQIFFITAAKVNCKYFGMLASEFACRVRI